MKIPAAIAQTIVDPLAYADGERIDDAFTWLRREAPLAVAAPDGFDPFWVVTRFADIQEVERASDLFHNGDRSAVLTDKVALAQTMAMTGGDPNLVKSLVQMDDPDHRKYRRLTQDNFLPQNLRAREPRIREIARHFIDKMAGMGGQCDFARDIAFLYPLHVVMEILGVPEADEPLMLKLTQELFGASDPTLNRSGEKMDSMQIALAVQQTVSDMITYFDKVTNDRRAHPRDDLASVIANGRIDGEPLGYREAMSYYIIAATAGHDTTSNTTAGGMWALAENPALLARLRADMSLLPAFIEETVRWTTAVKHFMRAATADTELGGQKIAKGDWLMLCYQSGNRDEAVYDNPFEFDIDRKPNRHVAFGYGAHICIGQHLARMEMKILWEELLPRLTAVELAGTPRRMESTFVCGPKSVPIRYTMN